MDRKVVSALFREYESWQDLLEKSALLPKDLWRPRDEKSFFSNYSDSPGIYAHPKDSQYCQEKGR